MLKILQHDLTVAHETVFGQPVRILRGDSSLILEGGITVKVAPQGCTLTTEAPCAGDTFDLGTYLTVPEAVAAVVAETARQRALSAIELAELARHHNQP